MIEEYDDLENGAAQRAQCAQCAQRTRRVRHDRNPGGSWVQSTELDRADYAPKQKKFGEGLGGAHWGS